MKPFTDTTPKPLLKIAGRPLLEYTFDALPDAVDEVIVVIGYLGEQIRAYLGRNFRGRRICYVEQKKLEGTAKALSEAKPFLTGKFLVLAADDIYAREDLEGAVTRNLALVAMRTDVAGPGGRVILNARGVLKDVVEEKDIPAGTLVSVSAYVLSERIFDYEPVKLTDREGEWGLPQTVAKMSREHPVAVVEATCWIKITAPDDLLLAERELKVA